MVERFLSFFTDNIICVSKAVQRFVVEREGIRENRTSVIYNGISFPWNGLSSEDRKAKRASVSVSSQDVVIIEVASLTANKGHHILLNACQQVYKKNPAIKLIIVGDGPLQSTLQEEAKQLGMESAVIFTGQRKDVYELLAMSDIFILPSMTREGLSIAMIEAMAMGLPVIGSNVGGIPELIEDRVNGFLLPPGDTDKLTSAIDTLVTEQDLREGMGKQGRRIFEERFTLTRMIKQIEVLYDHLLKNKVRVVRS
jgi:glycosyltransferase involved in cell wall biosynthesis